MKMKKSSTHGFSVINFIITVDISVFQVAELKAHMPMEMLRMIKRTFRDALGKLLNSKPLSLIKVKTQQKHLCTLMKTRDKCSIYITNKYIHVHELWAKINKQSSKINKLTLKMTGVCCPIFKSKIGKCSFWGGGGMGKAGCTDLLSFPALYISFTKN